jgi:hypothetical protein
MVAAGVVGLKLHEDWGTTPAVIDCALTFADLNDIGPPRVPCRTPAMPITAISLPQNSHTIVHTQKRTKVLPPVRS